MAKRVNYRLRIRRQMEGLGLYRVEYDDAIDILAKLREQYDTLYARFIEDGMQVTERTATGSKKSPVVTTLESLRRDILAYMGSLGLTPRGARMLDAGGAKSDGEDALTNALSKLADDG